MKLIKIKSVYKDWPMWINSERIVSITKSLENRVVIALDNRDVFEVEESEEQILEQIQPGAKKK